MSRPNAIELLHEAQTDHGFVDDDTLMRLSREHGVPLYELEGLVSFYPHFRRTPPPSIAIGVCRDVACAMRGGDALRARLEAAARTAGTAGGGEIEVESVSCLGRCDRAPACSLGDEPASPETLCTGLGLPEGALDAFTSREVSTAADGFDACDPYPNAAAHYGALRDWLSDGDSTSLIGRLDASGLRGMGGAGFPAARKWQAVSDASGDRKYAICNADESEPGTFKDREILARKPHLVIEGLALAALCVGAETGIVFVRHEYAPETRGLRAEIDRARAAGALGEDVFGSGRRFDVDVFVSPGGYVLGEETALLEALEGRRGEPRNKPPFPGVVGLYGQPTLIHNVETLSAVPRIAKGASADLKFFSVSGDVERPGVHLVPIGTPLSHLIEACGGMRDGQSLAAFLPGGASTGFLGAEHVERPLEWESLREAGSALGSGAVVVVGDGADLRAIARNLTAFFRNESCGKCVPCRIGTDQAVKWIDDPAPLDAPRLQALADLLGDTSICGLGQAALNPVTSLLKQGLIPGTGTDAGREETP